MNSSLVYLRIASCPSRCQINFNEILPFRAELFPGEGEAGKTDKINLVLDNITLIMCRLVVVRI
jgi:hypothetical protein